jgi:hypothetical protein
MGRLLFPLFLISLGVFGLIEHDMLTDQWAAMYPEDAAQQKALTRCMQEDGVFNRFSAVARTVCYQKYLQVQLPTVAPGIIVGVPGAPTRGVPQAPTVRTNH